MTVTLAAEQAAKNSSQQKYVWLWRSSDGSAIDMAKAGAAKDGIGDNRLALVQVLTDDGHGDEIVVHEPRQPSARVHRGSVLPYYEGILIIKTLVGLREIGTVSPSWLDSLLPHLRKSQMKAPVSASYYVRKRLLHWAVTGPAVDDATGGDAYHYRRGLSAEAPFLSAKVFLSTIHGKKFGPVQILGYKPPWQALFDTSCGAYQDFYFFSEDSSCDGAGSKASSAVQWWPDEHLSSKYDSLRLDAKREWLAARRESFDEYEKLERKPKTSPILSSSGIAKSPFSLNTPASSHKRSGDVRASSMGSAIADQSAASASKRSVFFNGSMPTNASSHGNNHVVEVRQTKEVPVATGPPLKARRVLRIESSAGGVMPLPPSIVYASGLGAESCNDVIGRAAIHKWVAAPPRDVLLNSSDQMVVPRIERLASHAKRHTSAQDALRGFLSEKHAIRTTEGVGQMLLLPSPSLGCNDDAQDKDIGHEAVEEFLPPLRGSDSAQSTPPFGAHLRLERRDKSYSSGMAVKQRHERRILSSTKISSLLLRPLTLKADPAVITKAFDKWFPRGKVGELAQAAVHVNRRLRHLRIRPSIIRDVLLTWCQGWSSVLRFSRQKQRCKLHASCNGPDTIPHFAECAAVTTFIEDRLKGFYLFGDLESFLCLRHSSDDELVIAAYHLHVVHSTHRMLRSATRRPSIVELHEYLDSQWDKLRKEEPSLNHRLLALAECE